MATLDSLTGSARDDLLDAFRSPRGRYTAERASQLSGIPKSTVYLWARSGVLVPDHPKPRSKYWSYRDLADAVAAIARERFASDPRVRILNEASESALARVLPTIGRDRPILFWLDAHFPGADFGLAGYGDERNPDLRLPLERELDLIARLRRPCRDVILVDDLRIYEDGPFEMGNVPEFAQTLPPDRRNIDFIARGPLTATHEVQKLYQHTGYALILPRRA